MEYGPDFICIGAQKSGTSWLHYNLFLHPEMEMPPEKKINFYLTDFCPWWERYLFNLFVKHSNIYSHLRSQYLAWLQDTNKKDSLEWYKHFLFLPPTIQNYRKLFPKSHGKKSGDISPGYAQMPERRIKELAKAFPNLKIIYLLRNPIDRTWSQFKMINKDLLLTKKDNNDIDTDILRHIMDEKYIFLSNYKISLEHWERFFPGRVKVWFYDQLCENSENVFMEICEYLDISPIIDFEGNKIKEKVFEGSSDVMPENVCKYLSDIFQKEIIYLHRRFNNVYTKRWSDNCMFNLAAL